MLGASAATLRLASVRTTAHPGSRTWLLSRRSATLDWCHLPLSRVRVAPYREPVHRLPGTLGEGMLDMILTRVCDVS
jgi:hypothetical protein